MVTWFTIGAFVILVGIPVAIGLPTIPDRLWDLREGIRGIVYVPLLWLILFPTAGLAVVLAEYVTILQWGWLGANIAVAPLAGSGGNGGGSGVPVLYLAVFVPVVVLAFLIFNYYEEHALYRESYTGVAGWALLHLIMGIPLLAVIPLFAVGCGFKAIYDRRGRLEAYVAHVCSNLGLLGLLVTGVLIGAV